MVCWLICVRCRVRSRKWLSPRASFRTSPQMRRTDRDPWSRGAQHGGKSLSQAPEKESPEGIARMADCNGCLLWPNLHQATKAAVGIVPSENAEVEELRAWLVDGGDIRSDPGIAREIFEFIEEHQVRSVAISDGIIGCPHQEGIDYEGEWCPICEFWHGRDRFTGQRVH